MNDEQLDDWGTFPLSGFNKITYQEFMGIVQVLNIYSSLGENEKEIVMLVMDGMKYRERIKYAK